MLRCRRLVWLVKPQGSIDPCYGGNCITIDQMSLKRFFTIKFRGLRNDDHFNVNQYWLEISIENGLILSRSYAGTIRKPILWVLQKMITYGLCQKIIGYDKVQRNELWLMSMFEAKNQNGSLDTTTLKELINSNSRLIAEEPTPGDPRFAGELERMPRRQSYHSHRHAGLFGYMVGHYDVPLQGDYAPPNYLRSSRSRRRRSSVKMIQV
nr:hypothetical protein [Tanacetum cinerariifolium]